MGRGDLVGHGVFSRTGVAPCSADGARPLIFYQIHAGVGRRHDSVDGAPSAASVARPTLALMLNSSPLFMRKRVSISSWSNLWAKPGRRWRGLGHQDDELVARRSGSKGPARAQLLEPTAGLGEQFAAYQVAVLVV